MIVFNLQEVEQLELLAQKYGYDSVVE